MEDLPPETQTFIVMRRHCHQRNGEPLADHFVRRYRQMLERVTVLELDEDTDQRSRGGAGGLTACETPPSRRSPTAVFCPLKP